MLKRTISGACYVAIIIGFFMLRAYVDYRLFNLLTYFFIGLGTFELARAIKPFMLKNFCVVAVCFGILFSPVYFISEYLLFKGYGWAVALCFSLLFIIAIALIGLCNKQGYKKIVVSLLPYVYPALFMLTCLLANELTANSLVCLVLIFVIAPCADTLAYLVGMVYNKIRKGKAKKLCPKLSPKKTVAGAIGGLIGGGLGSLIVYLIFKPVLSCNSPILLFIAIGLIGAVLSIIGDLFESFIKRKAGIKDSGKIMPGHGGVLDRIDGMMFTSVFVYLVFLLI